MSPKAEMKGRKEQYEQIPDVEKIDDISPQERYPEANTEEAELLGLLDEFIKDSTVSVKLPVCTRYDFPLGSSSFVEYILSVLLGPTLCFLALAGVGIFWIGAHFAVADKYVGLFEYAVVLLGFVSSALPIQKRYTQQSRRISTMVGSTKRVAVKAVEDVATGVASKVDLVKMKLCDVVIAMRPKLERAATEEKSLKSMDPSIEIPDPNNVISELDGAKGEIEESVRLVEEILPVTPWIPMHLRSQELYQRQVVNKVLILCLGLQLLGFYATVAYFSQYEGTPPVVVKNGLMGRIADTISTILAFKSAETDTASLSKEINASLNIVWPLPLALVLEGYAMSIVQLTIVFLKTRVSTTVAIVNEVRTSVTEKTNHVLRQQGIIFLCQDILDIRMGRVKNKLLKMISLMFKIDMLMKINDENASISTSSLGSPPGSPTPSTPSRRQRLSQIFSKSP